eukprot:m.8681 g.8681  ORF g.8681 m.8681 type:complete len:1381 (+) comp6678_c0_seq2:190-4332(+)
MVDSGDRDGNSILRRSTSYQNALEKDPKGYIEVDSIVENDATDSVSGDFRSSNGAPSSQKSTNNDSSKEIKPQIAGSQRSSSGTTEIIRPCAGIDGGVFWHKQWRYNRVYDKKNKRPLHPIDRKLRTPSSLIERLTFNWFSPLIARAQQNMLTPDDMLPLPIHDEARQLADALEASWQHEQELYGKDASLWRTYWRPLKWRFLQTTAYHAAEGVSLIVQAIMVGRLIKAVDENQSVQDMYIYAMGVSITTFLTTCVLHHLAFMQGWRVGQVMMTATLGVVYRKAIKIRLQEMSKVTSGFIVNLVTNDSERFQQASIFIHFLLLSPIQLAIVTWLIWRQLGWPALFGAIIMAVCTPLYVWFGSVLKRLRHRASGETDKRVKIVSEILKGMRVLKMNAWVRPFRELLSKLRRDEIRELRHINMTRAIQMGLYFCTPVILSFAVFVPYVLNKNTLTDEKVFATISLFNAVRFTVGQCLPVAIQSLAEIQVVFARLQRMLSLDENAVVAAAPHEAVLASELPGAALSPGSDPRTQRPPQGVSIAVRNLTCRWTDDETTLSDVSFTVAPGEFVMVVGAVGSGKTSLLMALLRELDMDPGGSVELSPGASVAYAPQEAWILSDTVRNNILFGLPFDPVHYRHVISKCQLTRDLEILPQGDATEVGERGVTLSGGQRARIGLARAAYSRRNVMLLDDPLSAVDAKVASNLFSECLEDLLGGSTRILVTHQVQYAPHVDKILVLKEGKALAFGTYDEVQAAGINLLGLLLEDDHETPDSGSAAASPPPISPADDAKTGTEGKNEPKSAKSETREKGSIKAGLYWKYLRAGASLVSAIVIVCLMVLGQASEMMTNWFVKYWASISADEQGEDKYYLIYTGLLVGTIALAFARALLFMHCTMKSSVALHDQALGAVLHSAIGFFDATPIGQILNRFSKDLGYVDDLLPATFLDFIIGALTVVGGILLAAIVNPYMFLVVAPLTYVFFRLRAYYLRASREIKRVEATRRSPKYSLFSASLTGVVTIRSRNAVDRFMRMMERFQNEHASAYLMFIVASRWLGFRLDLLTFTFTTCVTFSGVALRDSLGAGNLGLTLVYVFMLTGLFQWVVRQSAEVENQMISVERLMEYARLPWENDMGKTVPENWPSQGAVEFKNFSMSYTSGGHEVLHDISIAIHPKEKIGIVGRTGAGKSSLMEAIFRLSHNTGAILIDGVDTRTVPLELLRSKISVIPQEPVLFSGTLRLNVDPFNVCSDADIWGVLNDVQLNSVVSEQGLNTVVSEDGSNFSVGQRQLICLARALLKPNKILILDEATANIDIETDELIQDVIRAKFADWTVLTIAHRLNTVMDSDRILVLDAGTVKEFAAPDKLLLQSTSLFAQLARHSTRGSSMA